MKTFKIRITILVVLFFTALFFWFSLFSKQNREEIGKTYASVQEASLPFVWVESCGMQINLMRGYVKETEADVAADTLTILPADRALPVLIENDAMHLTGLRYEIRSADLNNLIERSEVVTEHLNEKEIRVTLPIQNLVRPGAEYRMDLIISTAEKGDVHYYSRLGFDESGMASEMLKLAEDFSVRNFDYEAAKENTTYLESTGLSEQDDLSLVTLKSSFNQLTYGGMKLTPTGPSDLRLLEYSGNVGMISRNFTASGDFGDGEQMQFEIFESFVMRKGPERIYLMDYVRHMREIFLGDKSAFSDAEVCIGIQEEEKLQMLSSPNKEYRAFVSAGDVWLLDGKKNESVRVWSFRSGMDSGLRSGYFKHFSKVLRLENDGKLDFLVGGYQNRGRAEGRVGVSLFQYDRTSDSVTERAFIPSERSSEEVEADLRELSYCNPEGMFYFKAGNAIYALDASSDEYITVCDGLKKGNFAISRTQSEIAWQSESDYFGAKTVYFMQLKDGAKKELSAMDGQLLKPIGFIQNDLAVGIAEEKNVWKLNGIERELPFTAVEIVDSMLNSQTHYEENGVFLSDAHAEGQRIHLIKLHRVEDGKFRAVGRDTIVCNTEENEEDAWRWEITRQRDKTYFAALPKGFSASEMKTAIPARIHFGDSKENTFPGEEVEKNVFSAYGGGRYLGSFEKKADALNAAYDAMGFVRSRGVMCYCRAGTSSMRTLRNAENKAKQWVGRDLKEKADLYGVNLRAVLYFVGKGEPVLGWDESGEALFIYAYDQSTVSVYSPLRGQYMKYGMREAEQLFQGGRNDFYCPAEE